MKLREKKDIIWYITLGQAVIHFCLVSYLAFEEKKKQDILNLVWKIFQILMPNAGKKITRLIRLDRLIDLDR